MQFFKLTIKVPNEPACEMFFPTKKESTNYFYDRPRNGMTITEALSNGNPDCTGDYYTLWNGNTIVAQYTVWNKPVIL